MLVSAAAWRTTRGMKARDMGNTILQRSMNKMMKEEKTPVVKVHKEYMRVLYQINEKTGKMNVKIFGGTKAEKIDERETMKRDSVTPTHMRGGKTIEDYVIARARLREEKRKSEA